MSSDCLSGQVPPSPRVRQANNMVKNPWLLGVVVVTLLVMLSCVTSQEISGKVQF